MDERLQFLARQRAGEPIAELCKEFGISRKTGFEIFNHYQEYGVQGLTDRSPVTALKGLATSLLQDNPASLECHSFTLSPVLSDGLVV